MVFDLVVEGRIVDVSNIFEAQIGIEDGLIKEIKKSGLKGDTFVKVNGSLIFPGFIDMHVHLREPGWEYKEDFLTGTKAAAHGGVTTVLDMPNTPKPATNVENVKEKFYSAKKRGSVDILLYGGATVENINELQKMGRYVRGYKMFLCESTGGMFFNDALKLPTYLKTLEDIGKIVSFHCENQEINEKAKEKLKGRNDPKAFVESRPPSSEVNSIKNLISSLNHFRNLKANIAHLSTADGFALVEKFKQSGHPITCEVTPHHLFFTKSNIKDEKAFLRMNPPLRNDSDRKALINGVKEGKVDFLATDHAPHTIKEKSQDVWNSPSGVPGLDTYGNFVSWLIGQGISPMTIVKITSFNAANILGLNKGSIEKDRIADLVVLDMKNEEKISSESLFTKCGWSPFEDIEFPGRVSYTIYKGKVIFDGENIIN